MPCLAAILSSISANGPFQKSECIFFLLQFKIKEIATRIKLAEGRMGY